MVVNEVASAYGSFITYRKVTVNYTDLTDAVGGQAQTLSLSGLGGTTPANQLSLVNSGIITIPAGAWLIGARMKVTALFTGGSLATLTASLGISGGSATGIIAAAQEVSLSIPLVDHAATCTYPAGDIYADHLRADGSDGGTVGHRVDLHQHQPDDQQYELHAGCVKEGYVDLIGNSKSSELGAEHLLRNGCPGSNRRLRPELQRRGYGYQYRSLGGRGNRLDLYGGWISRNVGTVWRDGH